MEAKTICLGRQEDAREVSTDTFTSAFHCFLWNTYTPYTHATALISSAAFWAMQQNEEQHLASSVLSTSVNGSNNNTTFAAVLRLPVLAKPKLRQRPISHVHSASRIREGYGQDGAQPRNDHRHKRVRGVTSKLSLSTQ